MKVYDVKWIEPGKGIFKVRYALGKRRSVYYKILHDPGDGTISGCDECMMKNGTRKIRPERWKLLGKGRGPNFCDVCNGFGKCPEVQEFIRENNLDSYSMTYPIFDKTYVRTFLLGW